MAPRRRQLAETPRPANEQEKCFVVEYLVDKDPKAAALRAGYSQDVASNAEVALLRDPAIEAEIVRQLEKRVIRTALPMDRVVLELGRLATYDPADCFDDDGRLLPLDQMAEDTRRSIQSFKMGARGEVEIKFVSKIDALKELTDHIQPPGATSIRQTRNEAMLANTLHEVLKRAALRPAMERPIHKVIASNDRRTLVEVTVTSDDVPEEDVTPGRKNE